MVQRKETNETAVKAMYVSCKALAELHRTFTNAYEIRKAKAASAKAIPSNINPFDIIENFRRICKRELQEVTGV